MSNIFGSASKIDAGPMRSEDAHDIRSANMKINVRYDPKSNRGESLRSASSFGAHNSTRNAVAARGA